MGRKKTKKVKIKGAVDARRTAFIERYLQSWNATDAAKFANYTAPAGTGSELLRNPVVKEAIQQRLTELRMSSDEVISRLSEQSKGDMSEFIEYDAIGRPFVNVKAAVEAGKGYLIREIGYTKAGDVVVKFHDPLKALEMVGRVHGIFKDRDPQESLATMPLPRIIERLVMLGRPVSAWPAGLVAYARERNLLPAETQPIAVTAVSTPSVTPSTDVPGGGK